MAEKNKQPERQEEQQSQESKGGEEQQPQSADQGESGSLKVKIEELETALNQMKDQLLRKAAEFENYKKRTENDYVERVKHANEDLLVDLLPVIDDFDRSLKMSKGNQDFDVLYRGVELMYQKLLKILEAQGLKHYEVVGKPFDAHLHDALLQMPGSGVPPHTILEEVDKGYMLFDKVLRHAKVIVAGDNNVDEQSSKPENDKMGGESDEAAD